jgi:hypothetical protein
MLTPSDRRVIMATVTELMARHMGREGWVLTHREGDRWVIQKRFTSNGEIRQQLETFAQYRIPAQVVS